MSLTCTLLLAVGVLSADKMRFDFSTWLDFRLLLVLLVFLAGLVLSLYHALASEGKSSWEKFFMLFFAVIVNALSGLMGGAYALSRATGWLSVFPILNIVNGLLLLLLLRSKALTESEVSDENASHIQVALTAAIVIILFVICHYIAKLVWIQTLSICVAYATNIGQRVQVLLWWLPSKKTS